MSDERSSLVVLRKIDPFYVAVALAALPFVAFFVALGINLTMWAFTGHQVFPWIGKALK